MHSHNEVAIKVERCDTKKLTLKLEVIALKKLQKSKHVVRYFSSGRENDFNYLILERLGDNLATVRKHQMNGKFSMCTCVKLGIQIIDSLESIHNLGYIHRDVKPSNFCMGRTQANANKIFLIDFNVLRLYFKTKNGL